MSAAGYNEIYDKNISIFSRGEVYVPLDTGKYVLQLYTRDIVRKNKIKGLFTKFQAALHLWSGIKDSHW